MVCRKGKVKDLMSMCKRYSPVAKNSTKGLLISVNNDFSPVDKQGLFK